MFDFIQNQVLGMDWLSSLVSRLLNALGLDMSVPAISALHFFIYDTLKILILLCCLIFLISYIQSYFPPERARRILGRFRGLGANCAAALLGTVTPFCSCSSIPLFMGFTAAGLPLGVTFSFLISSPVVDLGSLLLLVGIFGWRIAAVYVLLGLILAVAGGALIQKLRLDDQLEDIIRNSAAGYSQGAKLTFRRRLLYARIQTASTLKKVFPYILLGVAIGAVIHNWIPETLVIRLLGSGSPLGVILAVIVGVPMYADIFGTVPIAEALLAKGAMLGVVLSFMMAVTTLSLPSLILLRRALKPKLLGIFIAICTLGIILLGYIFNALQPFLL